MPYNFRYAVISGIRITRVGRFEEALSIAREWFIKYGLKVIIKDTRKMFNPTIIDSLEEVK